MALWNAVDAASNNPTHADSALADLTQQLHDGFDHAGATGSVDELAALLPWTHHVTSRLDASRVGQTSGTLPAQGPAFHRVQQ